MKLRIILENIELTSKLKKKYDLLDLYLHKSNGMLYLDKIVVPSKKQKYGVGTKVMTDITKYADEMNLKIVLTPSTDFGGSSINRLRKFYRRFGFVDNKGQKKDEFISATMYRLPKEDKK